MIITTQPETRLATQHTQTPMGRMGITTTSPHNRSGITVIQTDTTTKAIRYIARLAKWAITSTLTATEGGHHAIEKRKFAKDHFAKH